MFGLLCLTLLSTALGHQCGVGEDWQPTIHKYPHTGRQLGAGLQRDLATQPIRLHFEYGMLSMTSDQEITFKEKVMPTVMHWFNTTLKVYPLISNLIVPNSISDCNGAVIPEAHKTTGVPNTDFIVYITGSTKGASAPVAVGGTCLQESAGLKNPLAGSYDVNVDSFFASGTTLAQQIMISIHELTHALVFSSDLFDDFVDSNWFPYPADGVKKTVNMQSRSKSPTLITLPTVKSETEKFFECSGIEGLELEDYGGDGVAGNHWEAKIVKEDYMLAVIPDHPSLSALTLALFGDSGWYIVDMSRAQPLIWGKGQGCDWLYYPCISSGTPQAGYCIDDTTSDCDFYALGKGTCNLKEYSENLEASYQYFPDPNKGGSDPYPDYCPTVKIDSGKLCTDPGTSVNSDYGETAGPSSRCIMSSLIKQSLSGSPADAPACFEVDCREDGLHVIIDGNDVTCTPGQRVAVDNYDGTISCPPEGAVCGRTPCPDFCYGQGTCSNGVCTCDDGFTGTSCNLQCSATCKTCIADLLDTCTSCYDTATLENGVCSCPNGYNFDSVKKICVLAPVTGCDQSCKECATPTTCGSCYAGASLDTEGNCPCDNSEKTFNSVTQSCEFTCDAACNGCDSNTECTACYDTAQKNSEGLCECQPKTVWNQATKKCDPCAQDCDACSAATVCTLCTDPNAEPVEGVCQCKQRFYSSPTECIACGDNTIECDANGAISCDDDFFIYDDQTTKSCKSCSTTCNSCTVDPQCYQCGHQGTTSGSTCLDVAVGYKSKFSNGVLTITFAENLTKTLTKKNFSISTAGSTIDTKDWVLTKMSEKEYTIQTNLKKSDLPISVVLDFNQE